MLPKTSWRVALSLLALAAPYWTATAAAADSVKPNVVVFLADDQGWGDLSVHGNTNISTPNIDSLARDGAIFDRFFVCPVCSPTRAEFLTGRYHPRGGVWSTSIGGERLNLDVKTIGDNFKAAGYATSCFGKWHNGSQYPYHPNARGFDEYYGFTSGHWGDYFSPPLEHNGQPTRGEGFITDDLTNHALAFVEKNRGQPFLCYVAFNTPHSPMQVPDRFFDRFKNKELKLRHEGAQREEIDMTRAALAMCENIDENVGRLLKKLDELKLAENTIVLYFSDNGPNSWRWNGGMKGRKGSTDEGGVRSPLLIRWPGHIKQGTKVTSIAAAIDLLPTLAELTGVPVLKDKPLDGVSLAPVLLGRAEMAADRKIFSHWNGNVSVRTQRHRLDAAGKLFDMTKDPGQQQDISKNEPKIAAQLSEAVRDWKRDVLSSLKRENRPFTVGYPEFPRAPLPARDGVAHGQVKRSASAPNCSYFTNWTQTSDSITWNIDVAKSGSYDVEISYTCPKESVGSRIELSFNGSRLEGNVNEANDPPLMGAEHDRVSRGAESYVKDFKPMRLGAIKLEQGTGLLTLRALQIPGKQVMDVRGVALTLQR